MTRIFLTSAMLAVLASASTPAQAAAKPGNCALYAEMTADTVSSDARLTGETARMIETSFRKYADAQAMIAERDMPRTYEASKAFGWDKATVDAKIKQTEAAIRAGFRTSTMEKDKVYMDHLMAVNDCALAAKSDDEMGQSKTEMVAAIEALYAVVSKG